MAMLRAAKIFAAAAGGAAGAGAGVAMMMSRRESAAPNDVMTMDGKVFGNLFGNGDSDNSYQIIPTRNDRFQGLNKRNAPPSEGSWLGTTLSALAIVGGSAAAMVLLCYKKCPSNRILVINGAFTSSSTTGMRSKTIHGGGGFVFPIIQEYDYLYLEPMTIDIQLQDALSLENIRVNVPSVFTVAIGTDQQTMNNAAVRLLGLEEPAIKHQALEIIIGQLRQVVAVMSIEDITRDREKFAHSVQTHVEGELTKVGLTLLNVNITNITDESGFIEARGRKAAAEAVERANVDVAEMLKQGELGVARNDRDKNVGVSEFIKEQTIGVKTAETEQKVETARLHAEAVEGDNKSKAVIADSVARLKISEATAFQDGETKKVQADAAVKEAKAIAEAKAYEAMALQVEKAKRAEIEAPARAEKAMILVNAEAEAEQARIVAQGNADAKLMELKAQAQGEFEILSKKAAGLKEIVDGCGGSQAAFQMLMLEHLDHLAETSSKAISNIKFDKVVVWDGGASPTNGDGNATSQFIRGVSKSLPPTMEIMKDVAGVDMPKYFQTLAQGAPPLTPPTASLPSSSSDGLNGPVDGEDEGATDGGNKVKM